jgi:hypothetical protein
MAQMNEPVLMNIGENAESRYHDLWLKSAGRNLAQRFSLKDYYPHRQKHPTTTAESYDHDR